MRKLRVAIAGSMVAFVLGCEDKVPNWENEGGRSAWSLKRVDRIRLIKGELIGRAILLYADENQGLLPPDLESLSPKYIGTNIHVGEFKIYNPLTKKPDGGVIIGEEIKDSETGKVVIRGDGLAYFLKGSG